MSINHAQLRAFHAVASEGSFTRAAAALRVTQPTISAEVKELEDAYAVKLFERIGRGVEITELGKALHEITRGSSASRRKPSSCCSPRAASSAASFALPRTRPITSSRS